MSLTPANISLVQGGGSQSVQVSVVGQNGFADAVALTASGLPAGVTALPSPLTVNTSAPGTLTFTASSSSTPGTSSISIAGISGNLTSSSALKLSVKAAPVPLPYKNVGGFLPHGFYDQSRGLLFATNPELNELDVISGHDLSIKARLPLPSAWGIDQMADGKTLVVGTDAQEIYTVDEDTYAITRHPCPPSWISTAVFYPNPVAMANGKVILIGQLQGIDSSNILDGGQFLIEWDSNVDTFSQLEPTAAMTSGIWETDILARSADHKWAVFSGEFQLFLYSSDSDSLTSAPAAMVDPPQDIYGISGYAVNADGSKIAVVSARQVTFIDRSFNVLGTVQIPDAYSDAGRAQFSADGNRLFLFYGQAYIEGVETIDAKEYKTLGYYSEQTSHLSRDVSFLDIDASGRVFFGNGGGVRVADSILPPYVVQPDENLPVTSCLTPDPVYFPLNSSSQKRFYGAGLMPAGAQIYLGGYLVPLSSDRPDGLPDLINIPASSSAGPVDMECILANGLTAVVPSAISYGVQPLTSSANLLPPIGNPSIFIYGFGLIDAPLGSNPTVTVGGRSAVLMSTAVAGHVGSLQGVQVRLAAGAPNEQAAISISSANGTGTLSNAVTYIPATSIISATGISQLLFDTHRNLLYALKPREVDVLNPVTQQWQSPLQLPVPAPSISYSVMALSPDGTKMALESSDGHAFVFNPDRPAQMSTFSCATSTVRETASIAITQFNVALLTGPCDLAVDLASMNVVHGSFGISRVGASADGTHVYGIDLNISSGEVSSIDSSTLAVQKQSFGDQFWTDLAVSPDGTQFAAVDTSPFYAGDLIGFFDASLHYSNANVYPLLSPPTDVGVIGAMFSPMGSVLIQPLGDSIEFWDAAQGVLRARLMMPEELRVQISPYPPAASQIAFDSRGQTIYAISVSGLTILKLPTPIDQTPNEHWPLAVHSMSSKFDVPKSFATRMPIFGASRHTSKH